MSATKRCSKCGVEKEIGEFSSKNQSWCKLCKKAYYEANKDNIAVRERAYYEANKDNITKRKKAYYEDNKDNIAAKVKTYRESNKDKIKAYLEANKDSIAKRNKAYYEANKGNRSSASLKHRYGITLEQKQEMFDKQHGACMICKCKMTMVDHRKKNSCNVDHCHKLESKGRMVIRGLLCNSCNTALGGFKDSPAILRSAIKYLTDFEKSQKPEQLALFSETEDKE